MSHQFIADVHHFINRHILDRHSNPTTSTPSLLLTFPLFQELIKVQSHDCLWQCLCVFISKVQIPFYYRKSNLFALLAGCIKWLHCILLPRHKCPQMQNIFILGNAAPIVRHHWIWNRKYDLWWVKGLLLDKIITSTVVIKIGCDEPKSDMWRVTTQREGVSFTFHSPFPIILLRIWHWSE